MGIPLADLPDSVRAAATEQYARQIAREQGCLARGPTPDPNPEAVARGKANARKGRDFENAVDDAIDAMRLLGIADLDTSRPGMRATPDGPRYTEKGSTDHTGVVAGGRFVRVELKTCSHPKMYLRQHVKPHQAAALDRALDFGGLAFLLVLFDRDDPLHWHRYDWRQVRGQTAVEADAGSVVDTVFLEDCVEGVTAWADREAADQ